MIEIINEEVKAVITIFLVIFLTQTLFFIAYSYWASGDPYIALKNFYNIMYNIR